MVFRTVHLSLRVNDLLQFPENIRRVLARREIAGLPARNRRLTLRRMTRSIA